MNLIKTDISRVTFLSLSVIAAFGVTLRLAQGDNCHGELVEPSVERLSAILLVFSERFPTSGNDINVALLIVVSVTQYL